MAAKKDFGKNILIGGIVAGVLAVSLSFLNPAPALFNNPNLKAKTSHEFKNATAAKAWTDELSAELAFNKKTHRIEDKSIKLEGVASEINQTETITRRHPLFYSVELWQTDDNKIIDLYKDGTNIHGDIPNHWFIKNGLQDAMCKSDAPDQDPDGDGFSNRDEYENNTSPTDVNSTPSLVSPKGVKMLVTNTHKAKVIVRMVDEMTNPGEEKAVRIRRYRNKNEEIAKDKKIVLKKGEKFGIDTKQPDLFEINEIIPRSDKKEAQVCVLNTVTNDTTFFDYNEKGERPLSYETVSFVVSAGAAKGTTVGPILVGREFEVEGLGDYTFKVEAINGAPEGTKSSKPKKNKKGKKNKKNNEAEAESTEENSLEGTVQLIVTPKKGGENFTVTVEKAPTQAAPTPETDANNQ